MGRRRKSDDAAGGFLLLLGIAVIVAIFLVRLAITAMFYFAAPILLLVWLATFRLGKTVNFGNPDEFDNKVAWKQICDLQSERKLLFEGIHQIYSVGFKGGLVVTAKSDGRLFHAGSRLGKKLNAELEDMYFRADTIFLKIRDLRPDVLSKIPAWQVTFDAHKRDLKLHFVSGVTLIVLIVVSVTLHTLSILPPEVVDGASKALLWNPDPSNVSGDLVISCGITIAAGLLIWPLKQTPSLSTTDLSTYERWKSLEDKWSEILEQAEPIVQEHFSYDDQKSQAEFQETRSDLFWFEILNVNEHATLDDIKRAYREAIRQYHPDKVSGLGERLRKVAEEESKKINAAFSEAKKKRGFA